MTRSVFHRDFSLSKACMLVALIGVAVWMGDVPHKSYAQSDERSEATTGLIPAAALLFGLECDVDKKDRIGVDL